MADIVLNESLMTAKELIDDGGDLILVPMSAVVADATNKDGASQLDTFLGVGGNTEQASGGWVRKVVANGSITVTVDDGADDVTITFPEQTWTGPTAPNDTVAVLVCLDGAADANRRVITKHDMAVTANGQDVVTVGFATTGFIVGS